jgi:hypothetical protein
MAAGGIPSIQLLIKADVHGSSEALRDSLELRRARLLRPFVDAAERLLDIHSMSEPCRPLMVCGTVEKNVAFARELGVPADLLIDTGHPAGARMVVEEPLVAVAGRDAAGSVVDDQRLAVVIDDARTRDAVVEELGQRLGGTSQNPNSSYSMSIVKLNSNGILDPAFTALIRDLKERKLLDSTIVRC